MYECKSCGYHGGSKTCSFCGSWRTKEYLVPAEIAFIKAQKKKGIIKKKEAKRIISRWGL